MKLEKSMRAELGYIAVGLAICDALVCGVFAVLGKFDYTVVLGALWGSVFAFLGMYLLARRVQKLSDMLSKGKRRVTLRIPYSMGSLIDTLNREAAVLSIEYTDEGIEAEAIVPPAVFGRVREFIPGCTEEKEEWED